MPLFDTALSGLASVFRPARGPSADGPAAPRAAPRAEDARRDAAPLAPAQTGFWRALAGVALGAALTRPGQGRRRAFLRRAIFGGTSGALALALVAASGGAQPARAQGEVCADRERVVERLRNKYGESRQGVGLLQDQRVVEVWRSEKSGSWTIVVTLPDGSTCLLAAGEAWEEVDEPAPVAGRPI